MKNMLNIVSDFLRDEEGLTMVEYAIAGALIAAVAAGAFATLGSGVSGAATDLSGTKGLGATASS